MKDGRKMTAVAAAVCLLSLSITVDILLGIYQKSDERSWGICSTDTVRIYCPGLWLPVEQRDIDFMDDASLLARQRVLVCEWHWHPSYSKLISIRRSKLICWIST